ncbi:MAG: DUF4382 domain-containing protein [Woeseiaceae bacterium]
MSGMSIAVHTRSIFALLALATVLTACGGSSSSEGDSAPGTGTVALIFTDLPTDDLAEINLDVTEAILIGGEGQQTVFTGNVPINLLDLENYVQPVAFGEVAVGSYTKLRLRLANLELVEHDGDKFYPALPANGKIDLLDQGGFDVLAGRTLLVEIDMDANKSVHVVKTGSGKYNVRPIVKVNFMDGGLPDKLARIEGRIDQIIDSTTGTFVLCALDNPDNCLDIDLTDNGCVLDVNGQPTTFDALAPEDIVVVIGRYVRMNNSLAIDAIFVEQGDASQVRGTVNSKPGDDGRFIMIDRDGNELTVELQKSCTRVFGPAGEIMDGAALQIGQGIEVEGVVIIPAVEGDPTLLRAAMIIIDGDDEDEQLSGTIAEPVEEPGFNLSTAGGDICVVLEADAVITLVSADGTEMGPGTFADLVAGQSADAYGELGIDGCFLANELVVRLAE